MRGLLDVAALWLGYWTLLCAAGLLALVVGTLVHDAIWPPAPTVVPSPPRSVDVWKLGPFLNPHQLQHTTLHVETDDVDQAWRVIGGSAA